MVCLQEGCLQPGAALGVPCNRVARRHAAGRGPPGIREIFRLGSEPSLVFVVMIGRIHAARGAL